MALTRENLDNTDYYRAVRAGEKRANLLKAQRTPNLFPNAIRIERPSSEANVSTDAVLPIGRTVTLFKKPQSK